MAKYVVEVTETIRTRVVVDDEMIRDGEDAMEYVEEQYDHGEVFMEPQTPLVSFRIVE